MLSFTFQYGSLWRRAIALAIDLSILAAGGLFLFDPVAIALGYDAAKQASLHIPFSILVIRDYSLWAVVMILVAWLYFSLMESSRGRATTGKRVMGLLVVTRDEGRLSFRKASLRFGIKMLTLLTVFTGLFPFFDPRSRALHDRISGSLVLEAHSTALESQLPVVENERTIIGKS